MPVPIQQEHSPEAWGLLLEISRAANSELELPGVLRAAAQCLRSKVYLDGIAVISVKGDQICPHSLYTVKTDINPGDSFRTVASRALDVPMANIDHRVPRSLPLRGSAAEHMARSGQPMVHANLAEEHAFIEEEFMAVNGVRSVMECPLIVRERLIGTINYGRYTVDPFSPGELALLAGVSSVLATAVANALAYEELRELKDRLQMENVMLREAIDSDAMFEEIVGSSGALKKVLGLVDRVAGTDTTVLITGETGTGKELLARAIHRRSPRAARALVKVNCAALPRDLIASELFGHEKGAFTGALNQRIGRFEMADRGTIFLDEIGELPHDMQVALLRVLQESEFERVGGARTISTDARVIAATNRDLKKEVAEGRFRSDRYYRLNVFPIRSPALRERREDIPLLVEYFVARFAERAGKRIDRVERESLRILTRYAWPGNIRELATVVERAVILSDGGTLRSPAGTIGEEPAAAAAENAVEESENRLSAQERELIEEALAGSNGRVAGARGAAARLGISASTLESRIRRLGIDKYRFF
ncbi:MAG TPA: sigma 54-interacting transcriptional regulator, partial [Bryobacteraceae bacterium]|nr:sigma 54-interacting transcriptional regulator [Bryobacteraceae bacterium]